MRLLVLFLLLLSSAAPSGAQPTAFTTDAPSPLKPIRPAEPKGLTEKFSGSVQLSGRFAAAWITPEYLQVLFFPDAASTALLPYERGTRRVEALYLANSEQAARLLLDPAAAQRLLAKELPAAEGSAIVTVHKYETSVSCDTRGYSAELVSASRTGEIVIGMRKESRLGC